MPIRPESHPGCPASLRPTARPCRLPGFQMAQAARAIGEVTGRKIAYVDVPEAAARKSMLDYGMSTWMVDGMMELHAIDKAAVSFLAFPLSQFGGLAPSTAVQHTPARGASDQET